MNVRVLPPAQDEPLEDDRVALSKEAFKHAFLDNLFYVQGKIPALATKRDYYMALAFTVRDRMLHRWISTAETYTTHGSRTVAYLSAEFLMGPHLGNNLLNLGIYDEVLTLVACEDLTVADAARVLGKPAGTARRLLHQARTALRDAPEVAALLTDLNSVKESQ